MNQMINNINIATNIMFNLTYNLLSSKQTSVSKFPKGSFLFNHRLFPFKSIPTLITFKIPKLTFLRYQSSSFISLGRTRWTYLSFSVTSTQSLYFYHLSLFLVQCILVHLRKCKRILVNYVVIRIRYRGVKSLKKTTLQRLILRVSPLKRLPVKVGHLAQILTSAFVISWSRSSSPSFHCMFRQSRQHIESILHCQSKSPPNLEALRTFTYENISFQVT